MGIRSIKTDRLLGRIFAAFLVAAALFPVSNYPFAADGTSAEIAQTPVNQIVNAVDLPAYPEKVRVGLLYGSTMREEFIFESAGGLEVGVNEKISNTFLSMSELPGGYYAVSPTYGYWLQINGYCLADGTIYSAEMNREELLSFLSDAGYTAYPAYADGYCCVIPLFPDYDSAEQVRSELSEQVLSLGGEAFLFANVVPCSSRACKLTDDANDPVFFFESSTDEYAMAAAPLLAEGDSAAHTRFDSHTYQGYLELRRVDDSIEVINILPLEHYVACINAGEIYNSWLPEVHKAFSVAVRTYTVANMGHHDKAYGFDVCCSTCCQHYVGDQNISAKIREGVEATAGEILLYNGTIPKVNYAAVSGGVTAKSSDVWGGRDYGYLGAYPTPWERFGQHCKPYSASNYTTRGKYTKAFTGEELYNRVKSKCPTLKGAVTDVEVLSYAQDSSFVSAIRFTDCYGNTADVTTCDNVRLALGLDSSNFVVGKAGETVTRVYYELDNFPSVIYGEGLPEGSALPDVMNGNVVVKEMDVYLEGPEGTFVFDGAGWGHGVGLSQYGAWDMTTLGYDYKTVLAYYFRDTELVEIKQPEVYDPILGDLNDDGTLSIGDVSVMLILLSEDYKGADLSLVDMSFDGVFNITDVSYLLSAL